MFRCLIVRLIPFLFLIVFLNPSFAQEKTTEPEYRLIEGIVFSEVGDQVLRLDAFVPKAEQLKKLPAVMVIFGGGWARGNRRQLRRYAIELAKRGFVCFAIEYRLAPAHKFPAQIEDCRNAVKWIRKNAAQYRVDPPVSYTHLTLPTIYSV